MCFCIFVLFFTFLVHQWLFPLIVTRGFAILSLILFFYILVKNIFNIFFNRFVWISVALQISFCVGFVSIRLINVPNIIVWLEILFLYIIIYGKLLSVIIFSLVEINLKRIIIILNRVIIYKLWGKCIFCVKLVK